MTKLITFDGNMASGKNTNVKKICDHLGIPYAGYPPYNKILEVSKSMEFFYHSENLQMLPWLGSVMYAQEYYWKDRSFVVIKEFWDFLISGIMKGLADNLINAFETIVTTDGKLVPICSFYLWISTHESRVRVIKRQAYLNDLCANPDEINIKGVSAADYFIKADEKRRKAVSAFAERHPFFHIIDGTRSEEEIFDEIVAIVEDSLK